MGIMQPITKRTGSPTPESDSGRIEVCRHWAAGRNDLGEFRRGRDLLSLVRVSLEEE
jgi:hypothetical protein